jgi:NAD(P)-dependent dehydrogenase (short-subunit alcohol dehydrogenase family)
VTPGGAGPAAGLAEQDLLDAFCPGVIETGWWDTLPEPNRTATFQQFAQQARVGRNGTAADVAHAITGLIENDYITGVVLPGDRGLRLT